MKQAWWRFCIVGCAFGGFASSASAWIMTLDIVEINGMSPGAANNYSCDAINNTCHIDASAGDVLTIESYLDDWGDDMGTYIMRFDGGALNTGDGGSLDLATLPCSCPTGLSCPGECEPGSLCVDGTCDCFSSVFIDQGRIDWVFFNLFAIVASDCRSADAFLGMYGGGATLIAPSGIGELDVPFLPAYIGTLKLVVSNDACGVFTLGIWDDINQTVVTDSDVQDLFPGDVTATITVDAGDCPLSIASSVPPNCEVDARMPHDPRDQATCLGAPDPCGWDRIDVTMSPSAAGLGLGDFVLTQDPPGAPAAPAIVSVTPLGGETLRIQFDGPINPLKYTCVHATNNPNSAACIGALPGDVNRSSEVTVGDVTALVGCLNGDGALPCNVWETDSNRDGSPNPDDILRVVDMLHGGGLYDPWFEERVGTCPSNQ